MTVTYMKGGKREYRKPFGVHTAESKWQTCRCRSCQEKRFTLESLPGPKVDWAKYRNKDEDY